MSIFDTCQQHTEIFHLKKDKLTFINVIEHKIKLKGDQQSVYQKPYKLFQS